MTHLKNLAMMGLAAGLLGSCSNDSAPTENKIQANIDNPIPSIRGAKELRAQLSPEAQELFDAMSYDAKVLSIKVANQSCSGLNECKSLSSCKSNDHSCAGKNDCKGLGTCAFKDKDLAVQLVAKRMGEKRANLQK